MRKWIDTVRVLTESDQEHRAALDQTGFWGRRGAGCVFLAQATRRFCIAHRSDLVEQPNTWGTWGGAIDSNESPEAAVRREAHEEAGYNGDIELLPLYVFKHSSGFQYHNFLALVTREFDPVMDWETQGYGWFEWGKWPSPLHPGLQALLADPSSASIMQHAATSAK